MNPTLFIDAKHDRLLRRIEIEPHDVSEFGDEVRVFRQLEARDPMRLQAVLMPDIANRLFADPLGARHRARAPVRLRRRGRRQGRIHDVGDLLGGDPFSPTRPRRIFQHTAHACLDVALLPVVHMISAEAEPASNLGRPTAIGQPQQQLRTNRDLLRGVAVGSHVRQLRAIGGRQDQTQAGYKHARHRSQSGLESTANSCTKISYA